MSLKIAMFGHKRIPSREGGIEIVVKELASRMVALGHEVTCYNRSGHHVCGKEYDFCNENMYQGVKIRRVPTINRRGVAAVTSSFFASLFSALGNYDVVHIHSEGAAAFCWLPKLFGKRVVVTIHGLDWQRAKWQNSFASKYIYFGEKVATKYADEIIVLSRDMQEYFQNSYGRETKYIPNGVTRPVCVEADCITKTFGLMKDSYILFLGRIVPEKGVHYLIEAFLNLQTSKKLVIAGGASDTDNYVEQLKCLAKNDDRIVFTGFVQGKILQELYSNAYIFVLPSDLEGMPLSLLEAMSYGNCCLVSNIKECVEVVEDKAITFQKADINDLKTKLCYLCNHLNVVEKYKEEVMDFVDQKYSWEDVVNKTMRIYKNYRYE